MKKAMTITLYAKQLSVAVIWLALNEILYQLWLLHPMNSDWL
jgi:hypothetical protein